MAVSANTDPRVLFEVDRDTRIATITLNNPERRNSYDASMRDALERCLDTVADDDDLTVVLLRGAEGIFSTGADMNNAYGWYGEAAAPAGAKRSRPSQRRRLTVDRKTFGFYHNLMGFPKVTVGEIGGYALGGGFEMALMMDIAVVGRDTRLGMPATRFLGPALGSLHLFFHRLGPVLARRMLLLGERVDGTTAADWGLIHDHAPEAELDARADALLHRLAAGPTVALGLTKAALAFGADAPLSASLDRELSNLELACRTADFKEGLAAFRERRTPDFTGR